MPAVFSSRCFALALIGEMRASHLGTSMLRLVQVDMPGKDDVAIGGIEEGDDTGG